ncbi:hypothetical protein [Nostoc sp.]|uniref:hypothetical protein n=1 Tax=Nostoc sp. TaxID=1180 RepID=UPI002FF340A7
MKNMENLEGNGDCGTHNGDGAPMPSPRFFTDELEGNGDCGTHNGDGAPMPPPPIPDRTDESETNNFDEDEPHLPHPPIKTGTNNPGDSETHDPGAPHKSLNPKND